MKKCFKGTFQFDEISPGWYPQLVLVNESAGVYDKNGVLLRVKPDGTSTLIETLSASAESKLDMTRFPFDPVRQTHHTHLFRSVCPVTGQPDWASVMVQYVGHRIPPESLLRYLVSFRNHAAFHETTIERIFLDLTQRCAPEHLTVYGRFLRRGGIDINPYRSTDGSTSMSVSLVRQ